MEKQNKKCSRNTCQTKVVCTRPAPPATLLVRVSDQPGISIFFFLKRDSLLQSRLGQADSQLCPT